MSCSAEAPTRTARTVRIIDVPCAQTLDVRVADGIQRPSDLDFGDTADRDINPVTELLHTATTSCKRLRHLAFGIGVTCTTTEDGFERIGTAFRLVGVAPWSPEPEKACTLHTTYILSARSQTNVA